MFFSDKLSDKEHREKSWNIYFDGRERPNSTIENYDLETGDRIQSLEHKSKSSPNVNHYLSYIKNKFAKALMLVHHATKPQSEYIPDSDSVSSLNSSS